MSNPIKNNPVGRLLALIEALPADNSIKVGTALARHLSVDPTNILEIMQIYADMAYLVVEGGRSVNQMQGFDASQLNEFKAPLNHVAKVIAENSINTLSGAFVGAVLPDVRTGLRLTSVIIDRECTEVTVSAEDLKRLADEVRALHDEILNADIDATLKTHLLEHIDAMARAIRNYQVGGAAGLHKVVEGTIGAVVLGWMRHTNPKATESLIKVGAVCGAIVSVLKLYSTVGHELLPTVLQHLHTLPPGH